MQSPTFFAEVYFLTFWKYNRVKWKGLHKPVHRFSIYLQNVERLPYFWAWITNLLLCFFHHWNLASVSLFNRYYFGRCASGMAQLVPLSCSWGRSTQYSDTLNDFSVTIPGCYKDIYVNSFFPHIARLWNVLSIECFPLTYDLNGFFV